MRPAFRSLLALLLASACELDTTSLPAVPEPPPPPPAPQPGTVYGRIVVAQPGTSTRAPAVGAVAAIGGTSLEATANAEGRFLLSGIVDPEGFLLVRFDAERDGVFEKQRVVDLQPFNVGVDRQIDLGDLVLNDNARVSGRVRLSDRITESGGHGGVTVFVPEGPFVVVTADDGTWSLPEMPEGPTRIAIVKGGYAPAGFDGLVLRGAEELVLREVLLVKRATDDEPGALSGVVQLAETPGALTVQASIRALSATEEEVTGTTDGLGAFVLRDLTPGVYSVAISQAGFTTAIVPNVAILSGLEVRLSAPVVLSPKPPAPPPCPEGLACRAADACRDAKIHCVEGKPVCLDEPTPRAPGSSCGLDAVCNAAGSCEACVDGEECGDPDGCESSRVSCTSGTAVCAPTGERKDPGARCGNGRVCSDAGSCVACDQGARCDAGSDCVDARIDCSLGAAACVPTGSIAEAGTPCGSGRFCDAAGACNACDQNLPCDTGDPCRVGAISCATGTAQCLDLGFLVPAGTDCGEGLVCSPSGACVSCDENVSCVPPNRCRLGAISCATGAPRCIDTATRVTPGTECGQDRVCDPDGGCVTCVAGAPCVDPNDPCAVSVTDCSTGVPLCVPTANRRSPGTACSEGRVCDPAGQCVACAADLACVPDVACRVGRTSCSTGTSACVATVGFVTPGTSCGAERVCSPAGACVDCASGTACQPADPCAEGAIDCSGGAPFCVATGAKDPGTTCGDGRVCNAAGQCLGCVAGARCNASNPCLEAATDCSTGESRCVASATPVLDGTTCGTNQVCHAGGCGTCAAGTDCAAPNACKVGLITCGTGLPVCAEQATNRPQGTPCGTGRVCNTGACIPSGLSVTQGGGQSVYPGQSTLTMRVTLTDGTGTAKPGIRIDLTPPPGVYATPVTGNTDISGHFYFAVRAPTRTGTFSIDALAADGARVGVGLTVVDPPAGTMLPVMNAGGSSSSNADGQPAMTAKSDTPRGFDVASDGTIYFADYTLQVIRKISPTGVLSRVAGTTGSAGSTGDGGLALSAKFNNPFDVALSADGTKLYVSDYNNAKLREIDLVGGGIRTVVGGGSQGSPGYGDDGPGLDAQLRPSHIVRGPDGALYVTDQTAGRIRRYDPVDQRITRWLGNGTCAAVGATLISFNSLEAGQVAFDAQGNAYVQGTICGPATFTNFVQGVVRRNVDGTIVHVAGTSGGAQPLTGIGAKDAYFQNAMHVAIDRAGQLFLFEPDSDRIRIMESATGRLRSGSGPGGSYSGDFGPYAAAGSADPGHPLFVGDDLYFTDPGTDSIRRIKGAGLTVAPRLTISSVAGLGQSLPLGGATVAPLTVSLADPDGQPMSGATIAFAPTVEGGGVYAPTGVTAVNGQVGVHARVGLLPGTYRFEATFSDTNGALALGGPVVFPITAVAPAAGTIFGAVNAAGNLGSTAAPVASTLAFTRALRGIATLADGTMFVSDVGSHCIYRVTPAGLLSVIAGRCGTSGFSGDFGPATAALLNAPSGLALSRDQSVLYVADGTNNRVRAVDLTTGVIQTFAGGSVTASAPYGDGGRADAAYVPSPRYLDVGPDGAVYVATIGSIYRIRKVDASGTISTFLESPFTCGNATFGLGNCVSNDGTGCSFIMNPDGSALVNFAAVCGTSEFGSLNTSNANAVVRWNPDRTYSRFAGKFAPATPEGTHVSTWSFADSTANGSYSAPVLARDGSGAVLFVQPQADVVRRVNPTTGAVERVAGGNGNGFMGNGGPATAARFNGAWAAAPLPGGHLAIVDGNNNSVRIVW